jgi:electron transfer flavoprotein beta subunit
MKIVVCVKQVLDPRGVTVSRKAEKVLVNREEYILDPASKAALQVAAVVQAAVAVGNGAGPGQVIALTLGPERADDVLREAMAFGADRAILLKDAVFDQADAWVVANGLAAAIGKLEPIDLVVLGARSLDSGSGELAPRLAEGLGLPLIADLVSVEAGPDVVRGVRAYGTAFVRAETRLPAVVSVVPEAFESGHANGWRLMDAYKKWTVETWSAADLGLAEDEVCPMAVKKEEAFPPERRLGTKVTDVKELVALLKQEKVI